MRLKKENICCSAYDRAAIKFRGVEADINFRIEDYEEDLKQVCVCVCVCVFERKKHGERFLFVLYYVILNSANLIFYSCISDIPNCFIFLYLVNEIYIYKWKDL